MMRSCINEQRYAAVEILYPGKISFGDAGAAEDFAAFQNADGHSGVGKICGGDESVMAGADD